MSSRPLFAKEALTFASENRFTRGGLIEYMDEMAVALSHKFVVWKSAATSWFRTGQVCLFLGASYVDQENILIHSHYAQPAEHEPFVLCFTENGELAKNGESEPWVCWSVFPPIEKDALLYLCLMGGKDPSALMDESTNPIPFCEALAAAETMDRTMLHFKNPDQTTNDGMHLEALVSGTLVLASHSNGFAGMTFEAFFPSFLYELGVCDSPSVAMTLPDYIASIQVPFLGPPNTTWPLWLPSELKLGSVRATWVHKCQDFDGMAYRSCGLASGLPNSDTSADPKILHGSFCSGKNFADVRGIREVPGEQCTPLSSQSWPTRIGEDLQFN